MDFQYRISYSSSAQTETELPLLFVARMMVIFLLWFMGMDHILPPYLPFFETLNSLRGQNWLFDLLDWVYWISLVMVFTGLRFRFFALVLAGLIFFSILASKPQFSNSFLYSGCVLFLIGIYKPGLEWIFRLQIALLYLGAGINKLFDADWISGQYFDYFFSVPYPNQLYLGLSTFFEEKRLAMTISFITIFIELGLGAWALIGKRRMLLVVLINFFHLSMLVLTAWELSYIFYFLMAVSSYLILPWDEKKGLEIQFKESSWVFKTLKILDFDNFFKWDALNVGEKHFFTFQKKIRLVLGNLQLMLFHKVLFGLIVLFIVFLSRYKNHVLALF
jgi:hypothetical protein